MSYRKTGFALGYICRANYGVVCRARSRAEFVAKMGVIVEEIDETVFWLGFLYRLALCSKVKEKICSPRQMNFWRSSQLLNEQSKPANESLRK